MDEKPEEFEVSEKDPNSKDKIKVKDSTNVNDNDRDKQTDAGEEGNNKQEKQEKLKIEEKIFDYLIPTEEDSIPFSCIDQDENIYENYNEYKYAICILLKDNSNENCLLLEATIKSIIKNLEGLSKLDIKPEDIYIVIFANQIEEDPKYLVKKESLKLITKEKMFLKTELKFNNEDDAPKIKIDFICKKRKMYDIESLKCFYNYCINKLKKEEKLIVTSVIASGVLPLDNSLKKMIQISFTQKAKTEKNFGIVVPMLDVKDNSNFFIKIAQYERTHFNIYNMNFYNSTASVPVCSLFNTMVLNKSLMNDITGFYNLINQNATIDHHDYKLGLYLYRLLYKVIYYNNESLGFIEYNKFNLMKYQDNWVNKFSGYYGNFFEILRTFITCSDFLKKIFMTFQIIGLMMEFIYPALSFMVIYSIFYEAFNLFDINLAVFMTMLFLIMNIGGGAFSMISNKSESMDLANYFIYIFMEFYYLLILICSIVAMDNLNKNKISEEQLLYLGMANILEEYKFNKAACGCLIVFTFLLSIIPMILKIGLISQNIPQMFIYLFLGAPSSTSNFLISKIWKAPETSGGDFLEERKGITIITFFLFNLFIGFLTFYNYNRKLRANCVMGLSIFYLIYLFFKIIGILSSLLSGIEISNKYDKKIADALVSKGSYNIKESKNSLAKSTEKLKNENEEKLDEEEENNNGKNNNVSNQEDINKDERYEVEENEDNRNDNNGNNEDE